MRRRSGIVAFAVLSVLLLTGQTSPSGCSGSNSNLNIGPSKGEIVGAAIGIGAVIIVGTVVLVHVHNSHHTIQGCVTAGPDGIQVHSKGDKKVYTVTGVTAGVKVGDIVKVHGDKQKHQKNSAGDEEFVVQKINKDYGPCEVASAAPASAASSAAPASAASTRTP
jgi:hypothetical protein